MTASGPDQKRYRVDESADVLTITIPARRSWWIMLLLPPWLVGWFWAETMLLSLIGRLPMGWGFVFLLIFLVMWTLAGLAAISGLLWFVAGKEIVSFSAVSLRIEKRTFVFREAGEYPTVDVSSLRVPSDQTSSERSDGAIAFHCGAKTVRFGINLEDDEAKDILDRVADKCPGLFGGRTGDEAAAGFPRRRRWGEVPGVPELVAAARSHPKLAVLLAPLAAWFVLCWLSFLVAVLISFVGSPRWLPLPWSAFNDFVEGTDGMVYVDIAMSARVLCYDKSGDFVASYRHPFLSTGTRLAAGKNGFLYFKGVNTVYTLTSLWEVVSRVKNESRADRTWSLGSDGKPVFTPSVGPEAEVPNRAVAPGELLFSHHRSGDRMQFLCSDGSMLRRKGNSLERMAADGTVLARYGSHWLYSPFVFPWPGALSFFGFFAFIFGWMIRARLARRERQQRITVD